MASISMAECVLLDDRPTLQRAEAMWRARVPAYLYLRSLDGPLPRPDPRDPGMSAHEIEQYWAVGRNFTQRVFRDGMSQETCRDMGHVQRAPSIEPSMGSP